jgi:hypothetical protein
LSKQSICKNFLFNLFSCLPPWCHWHEWCMVYLELQISLGIFENIWNNLTEYTGVWREMMHKKNLKEKISWHWPFKSITQRIKNNLILSLNIIKYEIVHAFFFWWKIQKYLEIGSLRSQVVIKEKKQEFCIFITESFRKLLIKYQAHQSYLRFCDLKRIKGTVAWDVYFDKFLSYLGFHEFFLLVQDWLQLV